MLALPPLNQYRPLEDDGKLDVKEYNEQLRALGNPNWFNVPWLYSECYMYRYDYKPCSSSQNFLKVLS